MDKIDWRKVKTGLNKTIFTRHFWEGADYVFAAACKFSKENSRLVFGLKPTNSYINLIIKPRSIYINDECIGHRAKRAILRKVLKFLKDDGIRVPVLGRGDDYLRWDNDIYAPDIEEKLNTVRLEYLGWEIVAESEY